MFLKSILILTILCNLKLLTESQQTKTIKYFLNKTNIHVKPFSEQNIRNGQLMTSPLDQYRNLLSSTKIFLVQQYYRDFKINYKYIKDAGKLQPQVSLDEPFPCSLNNTRSAETPTSVHRLRPGDIDIIAAMGDSITAGSAMMSRIFSDDVVEFRAHTALGGGVKDWRSFLTLPNILKVFNPNLYGYSVADTLAKFRPARFNVAEPFATILDMPYMAEVLIKRLQMDTKVDMQNHWKLISIFVGSNDVCSEMYSYDNVEDFLRNSREHLYRTLNILKKNIPRLMVNVIAIPDLDHIVRTMKGIPPVCEIWQKFSCPCLMGDSIKGAKLNKTHKSFRRFQQIYSEVASLPEFQLEEFAAVPRMYLVNKSIRNLKNGNTDLRYFAIDCFHFSPRGNAVISNMLWNDMLQVKTKNLSRVIKPMEIFNCPTEELPYISTLKNS